MTKGRTVLFMKDETKGNIPSNYRPIASASILRKRFTGIIGNMIYYHLDKQQLLPSKQKGCRCRSRETKHKLLIDKTILSNCRRFKKNLAIGLLNYKKAYDVVPNSWYQETMKLIEVV